MNKLVKNWIAFGLGSVMFAGVGLGFVGCDDGKIDGPDTPIVDSNSQDKDNSEKDQTPVDPNQPVVTEKKTLKDAEAAYDAFLQKMSVGKNFTVTMQNGVYKTVAEFAGDKVKLNSDNDVTYLAEENGKSVVFELEDDNAWHKDFAEENASIDAALSTVTTALDGITWASYDEGLNLLSGSATITETGMPVKAEVEANFDQDEMNLKVKNGIVSTTLHIGEIGTTVVVLPEHFVDEVLRKTSILYTEDGKEFWNVKLAKSELLAWLRNEMTDENGRHVDNQFGRPVLAQPNTKNEENIMREIVFLNPSTENLDFGAILDNPNGNIFTVSHFSKWGDFFKEKTQISKNDLREFLFTLQERNILETIPGIHLDYTTLDEDYETAHKQEFETLTKNVFERYHKEKSPDAPDYNGAKIYFAFKTPMGETNLDNAGYGRQWRQFYLCETNDGLSLIRVEGVRGLIYGLGPLENVLQNVEKRWSIDAVTNMLSVSKENLDVLGEPIMTIGE